ncbi:MAG: LuxR C-terminal-related transcriptional regulator [Myxococcota bacterium]|nr:LuxR C-terminal-related transcriptional regulator [Myxococcota bacterium]
MTRIGRQGDLIGIVEAAYRVEQSTKGWLSGIVAAAAPVIDDGYGVAAYTYDASNPSEFRVGPMVHQGLPEGFVAPFVESLAHLDANFVLKSFRTLSCGTGSEVPGWDQDPLIETLAERFGLRDSLSINGLNPDGHGCLLMAFLPEERKLDRPRRDLLSKLSCHLAAALRLRAKLALAEGSLPAPEAILDRSGKVCHAEHEARSKASRSQLRESALAISKARGPLRGRDPAEAIEEWRGLIAARWTLLEVSESDGRTYLVARQNEPRTCGPAALTEREQQVAALAALGHGNKLIAYNLGISHSTVRVLMARAAAKLGAGSRKELLRVLRVGHEHA